MLYFVAFLILLRLLSIDSSRLQAHSTLPSVIKQLFSIAATPLFTSNISSSILTNLTNTRNKGSYFLYSKELSTKKEKEFVKLDFKVGKSNKTLVISAVFAVDKCIQIEDISSKTVASVMFKSPGNDRLNHQCYNHDFFRFQTLPFFTDLFSYRSGRRWSG